MKKNISVLLALVLVVLAMSACGAKNETTTPSTTPAQTNQPATTDTNKEQSPPPAAAPSRDDINIALPSVSNSMDPHNSGLAMDIQIQYQIFESLYKTNDRCELIPAIAESYEMSTDGKTYTYHLRDNVYFHNGDRLTSKDVVWSFERAKTAAQMSSYVSPIDTVTAPDDKTIVITLKDPCAPFMLYSTKITVMSQKAVEEAGDQFGGIACLCGTGPYYMESYDANQGLVLKAFPQYYEGEASIKQINFTIVPDTSTALIAFQNGEFDYCTVPTANWNEISSSGEYTTSMSDSAKVYYYALNVNTERNTPLANKLVRQAIEYAIDKEAIIMICKDGLGVPADHLARVGYIQDAYDTSFVYTYDPDKTHELLTKAGYPNGCDIGTIQCSSGMSKVAVALQGQLDAVGIHTEVQSGEAASMVVDWRASKYDSMPNSMTVNFGYDNIRRFNYSKIETVFMKYNTNPDIDYKKIDDLFDAGLIEPDANKRKAIYIELEEMLLDEAGYVPLFYESPIFAWDPNLNAYGYYSIYRVYDWSWN